MKAPKRAASMCGTGCFARSRSVTVAPGLFARQAATKRCASWLDWPPSEKMLVLICRRFFMIVPPFCKLVGGFRNAAELAVLVIGDRLADFLLRVHDERAVADHRLVYRLAVEHQDGRVGFGFHADLFPVALEQGEFRFARGLCSVQQGFDLQHEQRGGV